MEIRERSIAKAISFRVLATLVTFALVWILTGNMEFAGIVGGIDFILKLILFYFHERIWNRVNWGKN